MSAGPEHPTAPSHEEAARSRASLYRTATTLIGVGLSVNLALAVLKAWAGWVGNSFALLADSVNSFGDVLTSAAALFALRLAQRPPSPRHPYGFARAEAAVATNIALVVFLSGVGLGVQSLREIATSHPPPPLWALWIAAGNVAVKEAVFRLKLRAGRRIGSSLILAAAWDHRADALSSLAVLVGLIAVRYGGPGAAFADELAALVVVGFILTAAGSLFRQSFLELLDQQADQETVRAIRATSVRTEGVSEIEKLRVRKVGLERLVDIHVEVDPSLTVEEAHRIGHDLKDRVLARHPRVRDVLVHLEPHGSDSLDPPR